MYDAHAMISGRLVCLWRHFFEKSSMNLPSPPTATLVTTDEELTRLCARWSDCSHLALDSEFIRTRTFYPKLGLIQVGDPEGLYLLDAVELTDWQPFVELMQDSAVTKILHSPSEDLELFSHCFGVLPLPLVDTQTAATLAGVASMPGYSRLVLELFEVELPKGQQRSDWLKRPLSESQRLYAGLDVAYLLPAWELMSARLDELDRMPWFLEEMDRLVRQCAAKNDPATIFGRLLKSNLNEDQAGALYDLVAWREEQARKRDLPRRFVVGDDALLELAKNRPSEPESIKAMTTLGPGQKKKLGPRLLEVLTESTARDLTQEKLDFQKVSGARLRAVREVLATVATEEQIPVEFLSSKRALEKFLRRTKNGVTEAVPAELEGWRWDLFGKKVRAVS